MPLTPILEMASWLHRWKMAKSELHRVARERFSTPFVMELPGEEWERFTASQGCFTEWRSVEHPFGRAVVFRSNGECAMPLHFHDSGELLYVRSGKLSVMVEATEHVLNAGDSHYTPPGVAHSAHYIEAGECFCVWPGMTADSMQIDILV